MGELFRRIYYLLNRRKLERELQNDIDFHREMLTGESRKDFGNATLMRERSREAWGWGWLDRRAEHHPESACGHRHGNYCIRVCRVGPG